LAADVPVVRDYCQWEAFNASCAPGHVVVMQSAKFGRMRLGRCVDTDIYIGCAADVRALFDARCSGRPSCIVQLPDATLHQQQACPKDVVAYLEASYDCVDGSIDHQSIGRRSVATVLCSATSQLLAHSVLHSPSCHVAR